jgi:hypothetical protein
MTALSLQDWATYLAWVVLTSVVILAIIKDCYDNEGSL